MSTTAGLVVPNPSVVADQTKGVNNTFSFCPTLKEVVWVRPVV